MAWSDAARAAALASRRLHKHHKFQQRSAQDSRRRGLATAHDPRNAGMRAVSPGLKAAALSNAAHDHRRVLAASALKRRAFSAYLRVRDAGLGKRARKR